MDRYAGFYVLLAVGAFIAVVIGRAFDDQGNFKLANDYESTKPAVVAQGANGDIVEIQSSRGGSFLTQITVDGADVDVLVDTGASFLTLRESDAFDAGIDVRADDFTTRFSTANGDVFAARADVDLLELGPAWVENVTVFVLPDDKLDISLLGMNVLRRFGRVSFDRDVLTIEVE